MSVYICNIILNSVSEVSVTCEGDQSTLTCGRLLYCHRGSASCPNHLMLGCSLPGPQLLVEDLSTATVYFGIRAKN